MSQAERKEEAKLDLRARDPCVLAEAHEKNITVANSNDLRTQCKVNS